MQIDDAQYTRNTNGHDFFAVGHIIPAIISVAMLMECIGPLHNLQLWYNQSYDISAYITQYNSVW